MFSTKPQENPHLYTAAEVKDILRVGINAVYELAAAREIPVIKLGKRFRFPKAALHAWIEKQSQITGR